MASSTTSIARFSTHAPSTLPTAMSGTSARVTDVTPVVSSGSDVTVAISTRPIQLPLSPVYCAMASP